MSQSTANVIDLEAFRQRKAREDRPAEDMSSPPPRADALLVPVWFCWVPMWTPFLG
jgi:hypothetical protein